MSATVRITPGAHETLLDLSRRLGCPKTEVLSRALEEYSKALYFRALRDAYARRSARQEREDRQEVEVWDPTLADGLASEDRE